LPLTQQQLGEVLGMSAVHINRTIKALRPCLRFENHHVHIEKPERIAALCQPDDVHALH